MSQENVEVVRALFQGFDRTGVEGMIPFVREDVDYVPIEEGGRVHGHEEFRQYFARWLETWDEYAMRPTEVRASGGQVLAGIAMEGRGRGSGVKVTMEFWQVYLFRGGLVARVDEYADRAHALEAVGLSE
ncbi:MAG: hypothetical protein QOG62_1112 [Thermoleophilaceae bacterium]|nr:hypothetical protein [Thermoleophilaceae bacterium]